MTRRALTISFLAVATAASCRTAPRRAGADGAARADTLRGSVEEVGTGEMPDLVLVPPGGGRSVSLRGPLRPLLEHVVGLGVVAVGDRQADAVTVDRFVVVSANGLPTTDGILSARHDSLFLATVDGAKPALVHPSPVLRGHVGGRVWVAGPIDQEPVTYGIIQ